MVDDVISNNLGTYVIEPGQTITFDGRASYDLDGGGIVYYYWFDNGSINASSTSPTYVKTYNTIGTFTLRLRVIDDEYSAGEKTVTIQVRSSVAGTKYYITDHLGSVRSTVNHLGQVVGQEDFWSYGLTMPGRSWNNGNAYDRYKFTGHERDSEGGLDMDYMIARNYDPEIGRFMGVDLHAPLYPASSTYSYAMNSPIRYTDPDGRDYFEDNRGNVIWRNSTSSSVDVDGIAYSNIGEAVLVFDGDVLTLYGQEAKKGGGLKQKTLGTWAAKSGSSVNNSWNNFSNLNQNTPNIGPIPEGAYKLTTSFDNFFKNNEDDDYRNSKLSNIAYHDPNGDAFKIDLEPYRVLERNGLQIHPDGNYPGTAGCIGVRNDMEKQASAKFLKSILPIMKNVRPNQPVHVYVSY